ncbi:uncharacterized protein [Littorina saxatilis]|uniref:Activation-induced cytidine deaminase AID domain-containing protein n=1 Tax=Littorina saxatilis TaxID=31220 RepID=A0AAN9GLR2_9CAEN
MAVSRYTLSCKSGWVPSNHEKYERFKDTLMHGEDWGMGLKYFAMYWINLGYLGGVKRLYSPMFENGPSPMIEDGQLYHAERNLLDHLVLQLSALRWDSVRGLVILQNASPCSRCSREYKDKLGAIARNGVPVTIVFSSFYNIRRPSCVKDSHSHLSDILEEQSFSHLQELKNLKAANILLETTELKDWKRLREALQLPNTFNEEVYRLSARKREDDALKEDLRLLMR